jgi:N,N'-diacetylbacillosaminyl-diphospho-undecaprenol alpha-1,3-N-acetylgalactosaminyltransferase
LKVLMVCNTDGALYNFRGPIIKKLVSDAHEVVTISSSMGYIDSLVSLGARTHVVDFDNHSTNVWTNLRIVKQLYHIIRVEKPDIVHCFTHKAAIFGTIAAKLAHTRKVFITITGLGTLFSYDDFRTRILRLTLIMQYKLTAHLASGVFFQNPDDKQYFRDLCLISSDRVIQTYGSGISLENCQIPTSEKIIACREMLSRELNIDLSHKLVVLFPARALKEKGFYEFYEGARQINALSDNYVFVHLGSNDQGTKFRVSSDTIESYSATCGVRYLGFKSNISDYMIASDIVALPSYYREGVPHSLIEALAFDKFIITTDAPGCRETVIDGWNGFLCKPRDTESFVQAILKVHTEILHSCANRSRQHCEAKFDVEWLLETTYRHYFGVTDGK